MFILITGVEYTSVTVEADVQIQFPREGMSVFLTEPLLMDVLSTIPETAQTFISGMFSCE